MDRAAAPPNRLEQRKQRTRAALVEAAQGFIAAGTFTVPIQDLCEAADVGVGSFYNHFASKEELFEVAVNEVLDAHGALLDALTEPLEDRAEAFAVSFRLTGRMFRRPDSRIVLNQGLGMITSDRGLAPRVKRDIVAATTAGRFACADADVAMVVAGGALLGLGHLLQDQPARDAGQAADQVTEGLLRMFGLDAEDARELCRRPLPALTDPEGATAQPS